MPIYGNNTSKEASDKMSADTPCVCHRLHYSCNPSTCCEAAKRKPRKKQLQAILPEESSAPSEQRTLMECTLKDIRQAAVNRCLTCGILYAGLNAPLNTRTLWISDEKEDDLLVSIKSSTDFVQIYSGPDRGKYGKYATFTFCASKDSGKLLHWSYS
jgi:hypothetical protein